MHIFLILVHVAIRWRSNMAIKVYSTPTCPYCRMAKDFLKQNKIEFEDIDVATNTEAAREMLATCRRYEI